MTHQIPKIPESPSTTTMTDGESTAANTACCEPDGELCDCSDPTCGSGCGCC